MLGWGPVDVELACRIRQQHALPIRYLAHARAWHVEHEGAVNPFRDGDRELATQYIRQVCYMINQYSHLPLAEHLTFGFERLVLDDDGMWRLVPHAEARDRADVVREALGWYAQARMQPAHPATIIKA